MNHILLPGASSDSVATRFGVHAMELLINKIMCLGGSRTRLRAKAFGGANVIASLRSPTVGESNSNFVEAFLQTEGISLVAKRLGGKQAVEVSFRTDTSKVIVSTVDGTALKKRLTEEERYVVHAESRTVEDEVTLF